MHQLVAGPCLLHLVCAGKCEEEEEQKTSRERELEKGGGGGVGRCPIGQRTASGIVKSDKRYPGLKMITLEQTTQIIDNRLDLQGQIGKGDYHAKNSYI